MLSSFKKDNKKSKMFGLLCCRVHPALRLAGIVFLALGAIGTVDAALRIEVVGPEELVSRPQTTLCKDVLLLDSPTRAMRRKDGSLVVFATHFTNWYFEGKDWNSLKAVCASAAAGKEDPKPEDVDDHYWIQALSAQPDGRVLALASHEYMGSRHPGQCDLAPTREQPYPCWFSSIIQLESRDDARSFKPTTVNRIVATPQVPYDRSGKQRMGFLTTSNIAADGDWLYTLIFVGGYDGQKSGTCLFRARSMGPTRWEAWNGSGFDSKLEKPVTADGKGQSGCEPLMVGNQYRALVRVRDGGDWLAVGLDRDAPGDKGTGVFFATSKDLLKWAPRKRLLNARIVFKAPECAPVYKYPTLIDHDAPGPNFDTVGAKAYVYLVKVILTSCKPVERQLVRVPVNISNNP